MVPKDVADIPKSIEKFSQSAQRSKSCQARWLASQMNITDNIYLYVTHTDQNDNEHEVDIFHNADKIKCKDFYITKKLKKNLNSQHISQNHKI